MTPPPPPPSLAAVPLNAFLEAQGLEEGTRALVTGVVTGDDGALDLRMVLVLPGEFDVDDVWHTDGMRATGSNDVVCRDVLVPAERTVSFVDLAEGRGHPVAGTPLAGYPLVPVLCLTAAAPLVGGAGGAFEAYRARLSERVLAYTLGDRQAEKPSAQIRLARADVDLQAARLLLDDCDWQWLFGFENREGIFDIHRSFKFCPLIVQKGGTTQAIRAAFMHRNVDDWAFAERHVLAYPRERVLEFSPYSKAILEIRSDKDLRVLQKIYANGVLLGDQSERGWGVKYAREFDMTNDSKLFPPLAKWESMAYQPDEYGHWVKGPWEAYAGAMNILDREPGLVLSRDGSRALRVDDIQDVALPLYEGRMVGQFDFSEKGWVSGKGRSAVWRDLGWTEKRLEPQYLMARTDALENGMLIGWKNPILNIGSQSGCASVNTAIAASSVWLMASLLA